MLVNDIRRTYLSYDSNFPLLFFIPGFQFQICTNKVCLIEQKLIEMYQNTNHKGQKTGTPNVVKRYIKS